MRHHIFILLGLAAAAAGTALAQAVDTTADAVYGQLTTSVTTTRDLLNTPVGVIFDSNSNLYVADSANNRVLFYLAGSTTPTRVYGQGGSFTSSTANKGGLSADSLWNPIGLALDRNGNLYVADQANNRVLMYPPGSTTATRVYGQGGSFTTGLFNTGGISANSLSRPEKLAFDSAGKLYVADSSNHRVLAYPEGSTTADAVWGQAGSFTTATSGTSATALNSPRGIAFDNAGNLYLADLSNNRVLFFPAGSTTATRVYGQANFTSRESSTSNMSSPYGIALDSSGNLFVADRDNHRVLFYLAGSTTATVVYGQSSFTTNTASVSATGLNSPRGLAIRSDGTLFVADSNNFRVVGYPPASTTATVVYGQAGNFNTGSVRPDGFTVSGPRGVAADRSNNLYVADTLNNRILYFPAGSTTATRVYGQGGSFTTNGFNPRTADSLRQPNGMTVDSSGNLYAADAANSRVLFYPAGSTTATRVYGQDGDFTTATSNKGGRSANSLSGPSGVAVDSAGNVYIADQNSHRVLYYPAGSTTATRVYGQGGSFTTGTANNGGISANSLSRPTSVALDSAGNLYVGDSSNVRVLYFPAGSTTATRVYGQSGFTTAAAGTTATTLSDFSTIISITLDNGGNLYISDPGNRRVLYFPAGSTTATQVYGQVDLNSNTNNPDPSANTLSGPGGVAVDTLGNLYAADSVARRVLKFNGTTHLFTVNTSPAGRSFSVNGTPYTGAQTLNLATGSNLTVATTSPQAGPAGTRYVFANWSNSGAMSQSVTLSAPTSLTASFTTQHLLTMGTLGLGTVTPATGFQNAGTPVSVTATPSSACSVFGGWSGPTVTSGQVTVNAPGTLTGVFTPLSGAAVKGSIQTIRGTPIRYRQSVSVQNTTPLTAPVSIVLDTFGSGVSVLAPASATGTTTACTGVAGRAFYTVTGVAPGAFGTVTFDFAAPSGAGVIYNATGIVGAGPR